VPRGQSTGLRVADPHECEAAFPGKHPYGFTSATCVGYLTKGP
jgi:hypothetical protein